MSIYALVFLHPDIETEYYWSSSATLNQGHAKQEHEWVVAEIDLQRLTVKKISATFTHFHRDVEALVNDIWRWPAALAFVDAKSARIRSPTDQRMSEDQR